MRHVRILGLSLAAVFAMSAMAAVPALAAKDPYSPATWEQYKYCPINSPIMAKAIEERREVDCFDGRTSGGVNGGYFSLGNVTVKLSKPISLQGAFYTKLEEGNGETEEEKTQGPSGGLKIVGAENGGQTLESPELTVQGGLGLITKADEVAAGWPAALKASFKEAKKNKETHLGVKIEVAGNTLYTTWGSLDTENLLFEKGNAFVLPLKVRMINTWLEKLGPGPCETGNEEHPVIQDLTTEPPGRTATLYHNARFTNIELKGSRLVDLNWSVPTEGDATGCGGAYESYVDAALNEVMELPHQHGTTVLEGDLFTAQFTTVKNELEKGEEE